MFDCTYLGLGMGDMGRIGGFTRCCIFTESIPLHIQQLINQPFNKAINQSINQAINDKPRYQYNDSINQ